MQRCGARGSRAPRSGGTRRSGSRPGRSPSNPRSRLRTVSRARGRPGSWDVGRGAAGRPPGQGADPPLPGCRLSGVSWEAALSMTSSDTEGTILRLPTPAAMRGISADRTLPGSSWPLSPAVSCLALSSMSGGTPLSFGKLHLFDHFRANREAPWIPAIPDVDKALHDALRYRFDVLGSLCSAWRDVDGPSRSLGCWKDGSLSCKGAYLARHEPVDETGRVGIQLHVRGLPGRRGRDRSPCPSDPGARSARSWSRTGPRPWSR